MIFHAFLQALTVIALIVSFGIQPVNAKTGDVARPSQPEAATGHAADVSTATGERIMVVTSNPEATKVGRDILMRGGNATDAAIAIQLVLGLVEPQSSGIGGGGFALYYDAATKEVYSFDGRETAPATAGKYLFIGEDGKPMEFYEAAIGGRSVGVPGVLAMLEMMHDRFGVLPWRDLFVPAIQMSEQGFSVSRRLAGLIDYDYEHLLASTATRLYFMPDSVTPVRQGDILQNKPYASTLRKLAMEGTDAFYRGEIGRDIARVVQDYYQNRGMLAVEDLAKYEAIERKSVCRPYRRHTVCTIGEPSGGLIVLSALGVLEQFNLAALGPADPHAWHLIGEASRLALADRDKYMGDPHYVQSPGERLVDQDYLTHRAGLISQGTPAEKVSAGVPSGWEQYLPAPEPVSAKPPGTAHFAVVDGKGNIVSMTSSIEDMFGSRLYVGGFLLNNQLTDFSFRPEINGQAVANRVEGGKRPRSSMAPVIVFTPEGQPRLVIGSAGGSAIPGYILPRIIAVVDWNMDLAEAVGGPNIIHRGEKFEIEPSAPEAVIEGLKGYGHPVDVTGLTSGLSAIEFKDGKMTGVADPRREGTADGL